jgi:hypothetical protein
MAQLHQHTPMGESTGDDTAPPLREDVAPPAAEQAGEVARPNHWIRSLLLSGAAFLIAMAALQWTDVVEWVEGEWRLNPKREAERDKQIRKIDDAEQYAFVANIPGYYECLHCPFKRIFLKYNEVWKYGVTNQGEKQRYATQFLAQRGLKYVMQFSGTYSQCLIEEKRKLFEYPLLPENLARPDSIKLVLPPGNLQMR